MLAYAEARRCRRHTLLSYFDERPATTCGGCDNCVRSPTQSALVDVTTTARKCFACVKATGQTFGAAHIIGVLRGSRARRILSRNHDRLQVFGTGKELTTEQWDGLMEHLVRIGFLERNIEFGNLHLTSKGWDVIHGNAVVFAPANTGRINSETP